MTRPTVAGDAQTRSTRRYTDPLGSRAPELERCIIRHRALQMLLIVYHAEELKREVIGAFEVQARWRNRIRPGATGAKEPSSKGNRQKRAFDFLVSEGVLTPDERQRMVELIGRRNGIAHHLDQVTADLTLERAVRDWIEIIPDRQQHDYDALDKLRDARALLSERTANKRFVLEVNTRSLFFETTERVLTADIAALDRRIRKLIARRRSDIGELNNELDLQGTPLVGRFDPRWPENRYGRGRFTPRGVEVCYRLFDMGKSPLAVAHLMDIRLTAARHRRRLWRQAGGPDRPRCDLEAIPPVRSQWAYDD